MKNGCLVTFRSVTFAQKAERALHLAGIGCMMYRTPRILSERGCGYCLHFGLDDVSSVMELLRKRQIPFGRAYTWDETGTYRELQL